MFCKILLKAVKSMLDLVSQQKKDAKENHLFKGNIPWFIDCTTHPSHFVNYLLYSTASSYS